MRYNHAQNRRRLGHKSQQHFELIAGHCDLCGKQNNYLKPVNSHYGPITICNSCFKELRPREITAVKPEANANNTMQTMLLLAD